MSEDGLAELMANLGITGGDAASKKAQSAKKPAGADGGASSGGGGGTKKEAAPPHSAPANADPMLPRIVSSTRVAIANATSGAARR